MFSSVQAVFLFDVNSFSDKCSSESELEQNVAKLKLGSLKLLTEFGAQTEKGLEGVRWSSKFYHSLSYKLNTNRKSFVDFNKTSFEEFENAITDCFCDTFDRKQSDQCQVDPPSNDKSHSFILKKSLQEILLDYNWDGPDISSPVKPTGGRKSKSISKPSKILPENQGPYNAVIVFTNIPQNLESVKEFINGPCSNEGGKGAKKTTRGGNKANNVTAEDFVGTLLDAATLKSFQDDKVHLNFVAVNESDGDISEEGPVNNKIYPVIHSGLCKLGGGLHLINNIVETNIVQIQDDFEGDLQDKLFQSSPTFSFGSIRIRTPWWKKSKGNRPRRPQRGPTLIWEDAEGISNIQIELEVLAVHGSSSRGWGNASVVAVVRSSSLSLLAMAGGKGHLYVCHAPNTVFTSIIELLNKYQLAMLLKLSCGGIAVLSPWAGGVGSLAVVSATGLATPPVASKLSEQDNKLNHPSILKFVTQAVEKCLKSAPAHEKGENKAPMRRFAAHQTDRWFKPLVACESAVKGVIKKKSMKAERLAMQERLQKKYRPQMPRPLATGEIEKIDLVDITQPPTDPEPAVNNNTNMSRAQQLVKKSHIVTAQQKVKEQIAEEEERVQATERRAALASEQARRSQALESHVLNTVSDPQNTEELVQSLVLLRERHEGETDPYTTAQTIINLALMHVKNAGSVTIEDELGKILGGGVLQTPADIGATCSSESRLNQYKLQALLHLELLWLLGYSSSCALDGEEQDSRGENLREHHIGEAVKHLRAISLNHNPTTMANFLKETILENYGGTLGEVLIELFEELNQPLPEALRAVMEDESPFSDTKPPSVRSLMSLSGPESNGSVDNPEEKRISRHPSLVEASKHRLVVPMATRALKRADSDQSRNNSSNKENADDGILKVRRNLFDLAERGTRSRLQRSHTVDAIPVRELRRSPRKKSKHSVEASPSRGKAGHKTPSKGIESASKGLSTPKLKKRGVLAPETPGNKIGQTIFNKKRICKSTGTTMVSESPDVKRACRTTPRRLRASLTVSRRNSFYSGARSRNWERAKTQLLADRVRGKSSQRNVDQNSVQKVSASYLFTEILSDGQARLTEDINGTPIKKVLGSEINDKNVNSGKLVCDARKRNVIHEDSLTKNTKLSEQADIERSQSLNTISKTPTKSVRRALSLSTPSKMSYDLHNKLDIQDQRDRSPDNISKHGKVTSCPDTPKHLRSVSVDGGLSELTPSKRVQFSLTCTPSKDNQVSGYFQTPHSKNKSLLGTPGTPKSILKTPKKTPSKTPSKRIFFSPDLFSSSKKMVPRSPVVTPLKNSQLVNVPKCDDECDRNPSIGSSFSGFSDGYLNRQTTPVKVGNIACYDEGEMELVSPVKNDQNSSRASLILHNTPKKDRCARNLLDFESSVQDEREIEIQELSVQNEIEKENDDHFVENSVNLDEDIESSIALPHMNPNDIEYLNSLMFGDDFDQNLNISAEVLSKNIDNSYHEYLIERGFCSRPPQCEKQTDDDVTRDPVVSLPEEQEFPVMSLPEKQESPETQKGFETELANNSVISLSESIEGSPSIDKTGVPPLGTLLNENIFNNMHEEVVVLETQVLSTIDDLNLPSENLLSVKGEFDDFEYEDHPSVSPEIPLDPKFLCIREKFVELERESEDSKRSSVDSCKTGDTSDISVKKEGHEERTTNKKFNKDRHCKKKLSGKKKSNYDEFEDNHNTNHIVKHDNRVSTTSDNKEKPWDMASTEDEILPGMFHNEDNQQNEDLEKGQGKYEEEHKADETVGKLKRSSYVSSIPGNINSDKQEVAPREISDVESLTTCENSKKVIMCSTKEDESSEDGNTLEEFQQQVEQDDQNCSNIKKSKVQKPRTKVRSSKNNLSTSVSRRNQQRERLSSENSETDQKLTNKNSRNKTLRQSYRELKAIEDEEVSNGSHHETPEQQLNREQNEEVAMLSTGDDESSEDGDAHGGFQQQMDQEDQDCNNMEKSNVGKPKTKIKSPKSILSTSVSRRNQKRERSSSEASDNLSTSKTRRNQKRERLFSETSDNLSTSVSRRNKKERSYSENSDNLSTSINGNNKKRERLSSETSDNLSTSVSRRNKKRERLSSETSDNLFTSVSRRNNKRMTLSSENSETDQKLANKNSRKRTLRQSYRELEASEDEEVSSVSHHETPQQLNIEQSKEVVMLSTGDDESSEDGNTLGGFQQQVHQEDQDFSDKEKSKVGKPKTKILSSKSNLSTSVSRRNQKRERSSTETSDNLSTSVSKRNQKRERLFSENSETDKKLTNNSARKRTLRPSYKEVESSEDEEVFNVSYHEPQQQLNKEQNKDGTFVKEQEVGKSSEKMTRLNYSSASHNLRIQKREMVTSETSETDNKKSMKIRKRKILRQRRSPKKERRKSRRTCLTKRQSLKELSSDDESFLTYEDVTTCVGKKRIFDDDSDFESPVKVKGLRKSKDSVSENVKNSCKETLPTNSGTTDKCEKLNTSDGIGSQSSVKTPIKKEKQQKIDVYLSPVNKRGVKPVKAEASKSIEKNKQTKQSQMPNDWKKIKPRHGLVREVKDVSCTIDQLVDSSVNSSYCNLKNGIVRNRKRKRKGVKLKLTKSGENYEVSKVDLSVESSERNSSTADSQVLNSEDSISKSPYNPVKYQSPSMKRKKNVDTQFIITPLRFTRHMSKDLSVSPELFSQLIALSPEKTSPNKSNDVQEDETKVRMKNECDIRKRKRDLIRQFNGKTSRKTESVVDSPTNSAPLEKDLINSEWTVQSLPGSPTMKTFKRKQKEKFSIHSSPRVELSPLSTDQSLSKPSFSSLMHLTVSPIVNEVKASSKHVSGPKEKPKSLRRLYKHHSVN